MDNSPKIVLTADETMMSKYRGGIFMGFSTCMPQGIIPDWLYFRVFSPPVDRENKRAMYCDLGLRMMEASLLENGFTREDVAVVHPHDLDDMVGDETEIVAIGGHDLLGINPPTSEFVELASTGPPYNRIKFLELLDKSNSKDVNVVIGGKSAWQVANERIMDELGIDYVHLGEGEKTVPRMFRSILEGGNVPRILEGEEISVEEIPNIRGGVIHGLVEIMRGCGRGCQFCTPNMQTLRHKPIDKILKDVKVNIKAGENKPLLHSEDILRYGAKNIETNDEKVIELFERVASIEEVTAMTSSHVALATVYHNPDLVEKVSEIAMSLPEQKWIGAQIGIETGSPRLMKKYMRGKTLPSPPEKWPEIVEQGLGILEDNGWVAACTLMNGLPGETRDDVIKTLELLDDLKNKNFLIVPLSFVSMEGSYLSEEKSFRVKDMLSEHWQVLGWCMDHNAKIARKLKDNYNKGNRIYSWLFDLLIEYLIKGAEKYSRGMKEGNPPRDYSKIQKNYTVPEVLRKDRS